MPLPSCLTDRFMCMAEGQGTTRWGGLAYAGGTDGPRSSWTFIFMFTFTLSIDTVMCDPHALHIQMAPAPRSLSCYFCGLPRALQFLLLLATEGLLRPLLLAVAAAGWLAPWLLVGWAALNVLPCDCAWQIR